MHFSKRNANYYFANNSSNMKSYIDYADFGGRKIMIGNAPPSIEAELIKSFFPNQSTGIYIDVGANHPVEHSQTYHLERLGWSGLLIEPLPYYCELLRQGRSGTVIQLGCSSEENHKKTLPITVAGALSTLETNLVDTRLKSNIVVNIETRTLNSILLDNNIEPGFEFLSIDIEGHEMEMFKGFDIGKWKPKLVLIEDHVTNHLKHNHLTTNGYQLLLRAGLNSFYAPANELFSHSIRSRLEFFRKYWLGMPGRKLKYRARYLMSYFR